VASGRAREVWKAPAVVRALRGEIRRSAADVVMGHVTKAHLYAWAAARRERRPYLWRQPERRSQKPLLHEIAGRLPAAAVICSSDFTAAQQRRWRATPVHRVYPGCETDAIGTPRVHHARSADAPLLGIVGRLQRWKRVELALRAMPSILAHAPGAQLRVIGGVAPGPDAGYLEELQREAGRLGIDAAVRFEGAVDGAARAIAELDVLVHCAEAEPFGLVVVEAMLRGVPVVAADEGGPRESLRDAVDGRLVDVRDGAALAAAVAELLDDPERRTRIGAAARARALERFTAERAAREIWAIIADVAVSGRG
jgi:glycosyltransferase involved in cell wall biosynthesis